MTPAKFIKSVWAHYKKFGRHELPWRQTKDLYKILVSEVMLQQTQVERVVPFYTKFIRQFPTAKKLADAPFFDVLKVWQGLGYNRRAKMLHEVAKELSRLNLDASSQRFNLVAELEKLPGVGRYTARAVAAFACNKDVIFVETNIRTAIIHHFFNGMKEQKGMIYHTSAQKISDAEIEKILVKTLPKGKAREWYSALMDYGAFLKKSGLKLNQRSRSYAKQSKFSGSPREARGAILREYTRGVRSHERLIGLLGPARKVQMKKALEALVKEGFMPDGMTKRHLKSLMRSVVPIPTRATNPPVSRKKRW